MWHYKPQSLHGTNVSGLKCISTRIDIGKHKNAILTSVETLQQDQLPDR